MRALATLLTCLALSLPAGAQPAAAESAGDDLPWDVSTLQSLGFSDSLREYATEPVQALWFHTRDDRVLTRARLRLELAEAPAGWDDVEALEVEVNGEPVATLTAEDARQRARLEIPVDPRLLGDRNVLTLRLQMLDPGPCRDRVARGTWGQLVDGGSLDVYGTPLPLRADLALLPLPFLDASSDRDVTVDVVFAATPAADEVAAAALVAGYFGTRSGELVRYRVHHGELPEGSAVVLLAGDDAIPGLALPPVDRPTLAMVDHPDHPGGNPKLLLVRGRDAAELALAVRALLEADEPPEGARWAVDEVPEVPVRVPYDVPRWLRPVPEVTFADIDGGDELVHEGLHDGMLELDFRIAPDLFTWPEDRVRLTVDYTHVAPSEDFVPRVDVELNGRYVDTLPRPELRDGISMQTAELELHRSWLRGFNRLRFYLSWPDAEAICDREPEFADTIVTTIGPSSALHFEDVPHFSQQPDIATFTEDGFPFTRLADLSETALVLPDERVPEDVATALSLAGYLASITGAPAYGLQVLDESALAAAGTLDRDLLVIGRARALDVFAAWEDRLPLSFHHDRLHARRPGTGHRLVALTGGARLGRGADQVTDHLARSSTVAAAVGLRSPLAEDRTAVVVTASTAAAMPQAGDLVGFTIADQAGGDVLLVHADNRWRFRVGPRFDVGEMDPFTRLRWASANHWLALMPSVLAAALLLSTVSRASLRRRARRRLRGEE